MDLSRFDSAGVLKVDMWRLHEKTLAERDHGVNVPKIYLSKEKIKFLLNKTKED